MADRNRVLDQKTHVSGKISDMCRYIGFGVVAVAWTTLNSSAAFSVSVASNHRTALIGSAIFGILTVAFDYLQFLCGYFSINEALKSSTNEYDSSSASYRFRSHFFWAKQVTAALAMLFLLYVVLRSL